MKTAVCLVVKNEDLELPYWLAWYKSLGFDSFIIYNDFSDDSTENVILSLSGIIDIRYFRNENNREPSNTRQVRAYNDAITKYKNEFDWIAFFDADEYLDLYGLDIKQYLSQYEEASLIAFNWCCVGTNEHISRPSGCPVFNYTKHGQEDLFWNKHTKVICRPKDISKPIYYVHNAPVTGVSLASNGKPVKWETPHGGLAAPPHEWEGGRLLHYQSRSLEHYVKRDKYIADHRKNKKDPLHVVTNNSQYHEISYDVSRVYISNFYYWMEKIISTQVKYIFRMMQRVQDSSFYFLSGLLEKSTVNIFSPGNSIYGDKPSSVIINSDYSIFYLKDHFGNFIKSNCGHKLMGIYFLGTNFIHCLVDGKIFFNLGNDPRFSNIITYKIWPSIDDTVSLTHPITDRFLGALPNGQYTISKLRPLNWEQFKMIEIEDLEKKGIMESDFSYLSNISSGNPIVNIRNFPEENPTLFLNSIACLDKTDISVANYLCGGILKEHLL
ncbi:MAG: glycosyltransferase family 2 protein [Acetobacter sp.]|nr:glycosyltransferase family 2 protein [Acetobacter sp.]